MYDHEEKRIEILQAKLDVVKEILNSEIKRLEPGYSRAISESMRRMRGLMDKAMKEIDEKAEENNQP